MKIKFLKSKAPLVVALFALNGLTSCVGLDKPLAVDENRNRDVTMFQSMKNAAQPWLHYWYSNPELVITVAAICVPVAQYCSYLAQEPSYRDTSCHYPYDHYSHSYSPWCPKVVSSPW